MSILPAHMRDFMVTPVCHDIQVNGETIGLHESGILWWPRESTLVLADLNLKSRPTFSGTPTLSGSEQVANTLEKLSAVLQAFDPVRVIALGDNFHDAEGRDNLSPTYRAMLTTLQITREWIWVTGEQDPIAPLRLCGEQADEITIGALTFRYAPASRSKNCAGEICGSLQPAARVRRLGRSLRRPCFVTDSNRLVLPAFGKLVGGRNVMNNTFQVLFDRKRFSAFLLGEDRLYPFTASRLICD